MSKLSYVPGNSIIPEGCFGISPSQLHRFFSKPHEWYRTEVLNEKGFTDSTSSVLGTIIHFIAEEFIKTKSVDKSAIYEHLYEEYVVDKSRTVPSFSDEEAIEDFLIDNIDPEVVDVEYIFNQYKVMGNALIQFLRQRARPSRSEELIHAEVLPGYHVCGSCDAVVGNHRVIDFKTTSDLTAKSKIPYEYKLQLLCYAYIYRKMGLPINTISIIWITHNQVNRVSETNGKPLKDAPTKVTEVSEIIDDKDMLFIESLLKLISESVQADKDYPQLRHIIWKDYRLKV